MDGETFASYLRRVRESDDPLALARLRQELDAQHPGDAEALRVVAMVTLKRVRLLQSN